MDRCRDARGDRAVDRSIGASPPVRDLDVSAGIRTEMGWQALSSPPSILIRSKPMPPTNLVAGSYWATRGQRRVARSHCRAHGRNAAVHRGDRSERWWKAGRSAAAGGYELTRQIPEIQIPETVQSVIAARIDSLSPKRKSLLQIVIRHRIGAFRSCCCARWLTSPSQNCENCWRSSRRPSSSTKRQIAIYAQLKFRHALIHEVAYGSLISAKRQMLHARVLRGMESQFREKHARCGRKPRPPCFQRCALGRGREYLCQAGDKAVEFSAYQDAGAFFELTLAGARPPATESRTHATRDRHPTEVATGLWSDLPTYDRLEHCVAEAETHGQLH